MNLIIHLPSLLLALNQYQLNHCFQNITGVIKKLFEILIKIKKKRYKATMVSSLCQLSQLILLVVKKGIDVISVSHRLYHEVDNILNSQILNEHHSW